MFSHHLEQIGSIVDTGDLVAARLVEVLEGLDGYLEKGAHVSRVKCHISSARMKLDFRFNVATNTLNPSNRHMCMYFEP